MRHLEEAFGVLWRCDMKLNPAKCTFGIHAEKFLGFVTTQRGIETCPNQIEAIQNMSSS